MAEAIIVDNLGKRFNRYHAQRPVTIMEAALAGFQRMKPVQQFWALRSINFTVEFGEMVGIIGQNGAGKSTLLQLVGGVGSPDEGRVRVNGRIGALLDLGAGFSADLTGRENVFVTAISAGLTRREVAHRFDAIVEFAELEEFMDNPLRTYSTGMQMRLAFSVAVHTNPQVLLVDEFLSVGDLSFQSKCLHRIASIKEQGCAIVLISHSPEQIRDLCDKAIWLRHGEVIAQGEPDIVTGQYAAEMRSATQRRTPPNRPSQLASSGLELQVNQNRFGSLEVEITAVHLLPQPEIESGEPLQIEIEYLVPQVISAPIFSVSISRENDGQVCLDTNTEAMGLALPPIQGTGQISLFLERLDLAGGQYFVNIGIFEQTWAYAYDYHWHVYPLTIKSILGSQSILCPPCHWQIATTQFTSTSKLS